MRVLPADVYDTLELSALAFGGIGGWARRTYETDKGDAPLCILGHAAFATLPEDDAWYGSPLEPELEAADIWGNANDHAVVAINRRKGVSPHLRNRRVSFKEWCKELDVVRGK